MTAAKKKTTEVAVKEAAPPPAVTEQPGTLLTAIVHMARDPSVDVAKLQALLEMQERMEAREAERLFNEAFGRMEPMLPRIKQHGAVEYPVNKNDPNGPKAKAFNFARYQDVDEGVRPILRQHGFFLTFNTSPRQGDGGGLVVTGELRHVGGHKTVASIPLPLDTSGGKNNLQAGASTFSYGRRYATTMLLNIVTEGADDDGKTGGTPYLNNEQMEELGKLLHETGTDPAKFLSTMTSDAKELGDVEQRDFRRLQRTLLVKLNNMKPEAPSNKLDTLEEKIAGGAGEQTAAGGRKESEGGSREQDTAPSNAPSQSRDAGTTQNPETDSRAKWVDGVVTDIATMTRSHMATFTGTKSYRARYGTLREENPELAKKLDKAIADRTQALGPPTEDE